MRRPSGLSIFIGVFALVFAGAIIPSRFSVTLTPSLSHRVFFLDRSPGEIRKGDTILFSFRVGGRTERVIKKVACSGGDLLEIRGRTFFCNGDFLGEAKEHSLKGERLEPFVYNGIIEKGDLFVLGEGRDSYDSRYFGFIRVEDVRAIAYPLF